MLGKPVTTRVELDGPELDDYSDKTLVAFIEDLMEVFEKIPEAHRKEATIRGNGNGTYTYIEYERSETDEEKDRRLSREATARSEKERKDKEQLARLKARYEP